MLRVCLVGAFERDRELSLTSFLENLIFLWFIKFIDFNDGPADLSNGYTFKRFTHLMKLLWIKETYICLRKDFIKLVKLCN